MSQVKTIKPQDGSPKGTVKVYIEGKVGKNGLNHIHNVAKTFVLSTASFVVPN